MVEKIYSFYLYALAKPASLQSFVLKDNFLPPSRPGKQVLYEYFVDFILLWVIVFHYGTLKKSN